MAWFSGMAADPVARIHKTYAVPGLAGMVVAPDGIPYLEVAGVRAADGSDPIGVEDCWHLGSNGKAITAVLYARLVEAGKARWGATIGELFATSRADAGWDAVTIEDLLSHHSGIADGRAVDTAWLEAAHKDVRPLPVQRLAFAETVLGRPPSHKRGRFVYANANYIIAGAAIEQLTGGTWEDAMRAFVFAPLGMASAGFGAPLGANPRGHIAHYWGFGGFTPIDPAGIADNPRALGPAGTMHMNLQDYAKFLRVFIGARGGFLSSETIAHLTAPQRTGDMSYALGWITFRSRPWAQGLALGHEGSNTLWHAFTAVGPKRGRAVVAVTNTHGGFGEVAAQKLGLALIRSLET